MISSIPTVIRGDAKPGRCSSLHKLIPGVHQKLPDQEDVKAIYAHAEEHSEEFNLYIKGEEGELAEENVEKGIERSTDPDTRQEVK